jgi:hypothetical protein
MTVHHRLSPSAASFDDILMETDALLMRRRCVCVCV